MNIWISPFCFAFFLDLQTSEDTAEHGFYIKETLVNGFQDWKESLAKFNLNI